MKTREDVIEFSKLQMERLTIAAHKGQEPRSGAWHYGRCEIMELIEYTYSDKSPSDYFNEKAKVTVLSCSPILPR